MTARHIAAACWLLAVIALATAAFGRAWLGDSAMLSVGLHEAHMSTRLASPPGRIPYGGSLGTAGMAVYLGCLLASAACAAGCWAVTRTRRRWVWLALVVVLASMIPVAWFVPQFARTFGVELPLGRAFYLYGAGVLVALVAAALSLVSRASGSSAAG